MSDSTPYLQTLQNSSLFGLLSEEILQALIENLEERNYPAGERIVTQGEEPEGVFVLLEGEVEVQHEGHEQPLRKQTAGDYFGELAILFDEKRSAHVTALNDVKTLFFSSEIFRELFSAHAGLMDQVMETAKERRIFSQRRILSSNRKRLDNFKSRILANKLRSVLVFKDVEKSFVLDIASAMERVYAKAGEVVIQQGDLGEELYIIARGQLEAIDEVSAKRYRFMEAGEIFGELALLEDRARTAKVCATQFSELYKLYKSDFLMLIERSPEAAEKIKEIAASREFFSEAAAL